MRTPGFEVQGDRATRCSRLERDQDEHVVAVLRGPARLRIHDQFLIIVQRRGDLGLDYLPPRPIVPEVPDT